MTTPVTTPVTIIATTWLPPGNELERAAAFRKASLSWEQNLRYDGPINLHVADDGTDSSHLPFLASAWARGLRTFSRQEARGVGASLNAGCKVAFQDGGVALYMVDDWELTQEFDLTPWVRTLIDEDEDWDVIRLGPPHPNIRGSVQMVKHGWVLDLDRYGFAFSFRPMLFRRSLLEHFGPFPEDCSSLEAESVYNNRIDSSCVALALPTPWVPIETGALSDIDPRSRQ